MGQDKEQTTRMCLCTAFGQRDPGCNDCLPGMVSPMKSQQAPLTHRDSVGMRGRWKDHMFSLAYFGDRHKVDGPQGDLPDNSKPRPCSTTANLISKQHQSSQAAHHQNPVMVRELQQRAAPEMSFGRSMPGGGNELLHNSALRCTVDREPVPGHAHTQQHLKLAILKQFPQNDGISTSLPSLQDSSRFVREYFQSMGESVQPGSSAMEQYPQKDLQLNQILPNYLGPSNHGPSPQLPHTPNNQLSTTSAMAKQSIGNELPISQQGYKSILKHADTRYQCYAPEAHTHSSSAVYAAHDTPANADLDLSSKSSIRPPRLNYHLSAGSQITPVEKQEHKDSVLQEDQNIVNGQAEWYSVLKGRTSKLRPDRSPSSWEVLGAPPPKPSKVKDLAKAGHLTETYYSNGKPRTAAKSPKDDQFAPAVTITRSSPEVQSKLRRGKKRAIFDDHSVSSSTLPNGVCSHSVSPDAPDHIFKRPLLKRIPNGNGNLPSAPFSIQRDLYKPAPSNNSFRQSPWGTHKGAFPPKDVHSTRTAEKTKHLKPFQQQIPHPRLQNTRMVRGIINPDDSNPRLRGFPADDPMVNGKNGNLPQSACIGDQRMFTHVGWHHEESMCSLTKDYDKQIHSGAVRQCENYAAHDRGERPAGVCLACRAASHTYIVETANHLLDHTFWPLCKPCGEKALTNFDKPEEGCGCNAGWLCHKCLVHRLETSKMFNDIEWEMRMSLSGIRCSCGVEFEADEKKAEVSVLQCGGCNGLVRGRWNSMTEQVICRQKRAERNKWAGGDWTREPIPDFPGLKHL